MSHKELVTVYSCQYPSEAFIFKTKLESEGIFVHVANEFIIQTDPLISNAVGGVQLQVSIEDQEKANFIISKISLYSVDDHGKAIHCPQCDSNEINLGTTVRNFKSFLSWFLGIMTMTLPITTQTIYRCNRCKLEFKN